MSFPLHLSSSVQAALAAHQPVVALESTLITHGLPRPINLDVARQLEATVTDNGAVPATIAILNGQLHVGLEASELEYLANADDVRKVSRRDLPIVVAQKLNGATTVAATMWIAAQAGIQVFATGGIGGVHRGQPFDVSADLPELAQTPVVVVCAGAKAILDLPDVIFQKVEARDFDRACLCEEDAEDPAARDHVGQEAARGDVG